MGAAITGSVGTILLYRDVCWAVEGARAW